MLTAFHKQINISVKKEEVPVTILIWKWVFIFKNFSIQKKVL